VTGDPEKFLLLKHAYEILSDPQCRAEYDAKRDNREIRANPILGVGLGAYETAFPIYSESDGSLRVPQAHNEYLQVAADAGIVGILIALWFIVAIFRTVSRGVRSRDPLLAGLALGSGGGIFAMLVHSMFDFNLQIPSNALLFLLLVAVAANVARKRRELRATRRRPRRSRLPPTLDRPDRRLPRLSWLPSS
jgi:O-antigen ligase